MRIGRQYYPNVRTISFNLCIAFLIKIIFNEIYARILSNRFARFAYSMWGYKIDLFLHVMWNHIRYIFIHDKDKGIGVLSPQTPHH
jgi:hypothetical protein